MKYLSKGEWHCLAVSIEACHSKGQGSNPAVADFYFLSFDGSARQLEIDGSVSDRKKRRKRKQLKSDGSASQLKTKTQRDLHSGILFRNGHEKGLMGSLRRRLNG